MYGSVAIDDQGGAQALMNTIVNKQ